MKELLRFLLGGATAVVVDYFVYTFLLYLHFNTELAKGISYICGAVVGFVINKFWTFESKEFHKEEIIKYILLYTCSALANAGTNKVVLLIFPIKVLAFLGATGVSTVMNFLGQKFFVFKKKENVV